LQLSKGGLPSVAATLPMLLSIVTGAGSLIQVLIGAIDVSNCG
jgi:hypothetical protein